MHSRDCCIILLSAVVALTATISSCNAYQTDYDIPTLITILLKSTNLTVNTLLKGADNTPIANDVTFWCGSPQNKTLRQTFINDVAIATKLNASLPVAFLIHGYIDNVNRTWVQRTIRDYLTYRETNVCGVDWNRLAMFDYQTSATKNILKAGQFLGQFIEYLNNNGFAYSTTVCAGHSLGAHICGIAGSTVGGKIGKIFGMDPAGPLITYPITVPINQRLDLTDAVFVQNIYTSAPILGGNIDMGHQNFYPNGGLVPQPFCIFPTLQNGLSPEAITCSHIYSTTLFRYALKDTTKMEGLKCSSFLLYLAGACNFNIKDVIGLDSARQPGDFYLNTLKFPTILQ